MIPRPAVSWRRRSAAWLILGLLMAVVGWLPAATHTWTGAMNGDWTDPGNWDVNGVLVSDPTSGLVFAAAGGQKPTSNLPAAFTVHSITFAATNTVPIDLSGIAITFNTAVADPFIDFDDNQAHVFTGGSIILLNGQSWHLIAAGGTRDLDAPITGSAILEKEGNGAIRLTQDCDFIGQTLVEAGTLRLKGDAATLIGSWNIEVRTGATLHVDSSADSMADIDRFPDDAYIYLFDDATLHLEGAANATAAHRIEIVARIIAYWSGQPCTVRIDSTNGRNAILLAMEPNMWRGIESWGGQLDLVTTTAGGSASRLMSLFGFYDDEPVSFATVGGQPAKYSLANGLVRVSNVRATVQDGLWGNPATWEGGELPRSDETVTIRHVVDCIAMPWVYSNASTTCQRLVFENGGRLTQVDKPAVNRAVTVSINSSVVTIGGGTAGLIPGMMVPTTGGHFSPDTRIQEIIDAATIVVFPPAINPAVAVALDFHPVRQFTNCQWSIGGTFIEVLGGESIENLPEGTLLEVVAPGGVTLPDRCSVWFVSGNRIYVRRWGTDGNDVIAFPDARSGVTLRNGVVKPTQRYVNVLDDTDPADRHGLVTVSGVIDPVMDGVGVQASGNPLRFMIPVGASLAITGGAPFENNQWRLEGGGILGLDTSTTWAGGTATVTNGIVRVGNRTALGRFGLRLTGSAAIDLNGIEDPAGIPVAGIADEAGGGGMVINSIDFTDPLLVLTGSQGDFSGMIQDGLFGTVGVTVQADARWTGTMGFSGPLTVASQLTLRHATLGDPVLLSGPPVVMDGGTLSLEQDETVASVTGASGRIGFQTPSPCDLVITTAQVGDVYAGSIEGQGSVRVAGGTWEFQGTGSFSVDFMSDTVVVEPGATLILSGGDNRLNTWSGVRIDGTLELDGCSQRITRLGGAGTGVITATTVGNTLTVERGQFSGKMTGNLGLTKRNSNDPLILTLTNDSDFTGTVLVTDWGSTLRITGGTGLGAGGGSVTRIESNAILELDGACTIPVDEVIQLGGTIRHIGAGDALVLGPITIVNPVTLESNDTGSLRVSSTWSDDGTRQPMTLKGASTNLLNRIDGDLPQIGNFTKDGLGTWVLAGHNPDLGEVQVRNGTLELDGAGDVLPDAGMVFMENNGAVLRIRNHETVGRIQSSNTGTIIDLATAGRVLTVATNDGASFSGAITGPGGITKDGTGSWSLRGVSSFTGPLVVQRGNLELDGSTGCLTAGGSQAGVHGIASLAINAGGTFFISDRYAAGLDPDRLPDDLVVTIAGGWFEMEAGKDGVNAQAHTETIGALVFNGQPGRMDLTAVDDTGACTLTCTAATGLQFTGGGTLALQRSNGDSGALARLLVDSIAANTTPLAGCSVDGYTASYLRTPFHHGVVADFRTTVAAGDWSDGLTWYGGVVPLVGDDVTMQHAVTIDAAVDIDALTFRGTSGRLDAGVGSLMVRGDIRVETNELGVIAQPFDASLAGFTKVGQGTLAIAGVSTGTGAIAVRGGILRYDAVHALPGYRVQVDPGATFAIANPNTVAGLTGFGAVSMGAHALVIDVPAGQSWELQGRLEEGGGAGAITKRGDGTQVLAGDNAYAGLTTVEVGELAVKGSGTLGDGTNGTVVQAGAVLALTGNAVLPATEAIGLSGILRAKSGTCGVLGPITLGGSASIASIATAQFQVAGAIAIGAHDLSLDGISMSRNAITGAITGSGGLVKGEAGLWVLAGTVGHTGTTTVGAGVLEVGGSLTAGGGAVTVQSAATLQGGGLIDRAVTVAADGRLAPGANTDQGGGFWHGGVGILTIDTLAMQATARLACDLGQASDQVVVKGAATLAAGVLVDAYENPVPATAVRTLLDASGGLGASTVPTLGVHPYARAFLGFSSTKLVLTVDNVAPVVTAVTSSSADGTYYEGDSIPLIVRFTKPVTVSGGAGLRLTLNTPAADTVDVTAVGYGTDLVGTFTVPHFGITAPARLTVTAYAVLPGTLIRDAAGNDADPSGILVDNLGTAKAIITDNETPVIDLNTAMNGTVGGITALTGLLHATDRETPGALTYVLKLLPAAGVLERSPDGSIWSALGIDGTCTQADIDAGRVRYRNTASAAGNDGFAFVVQDVDPRRKTTALTAKNIVVIDEDDAPVFATVTMVTAVNVAVVETQAATDPDGLAVTISVVTPPTRGVLTIDDAATGRMTYVPALDQVGDDSFVLRADDGTKSTEVTVPVHITAPGEAAPRFTSSPPMLIGENQVLLYSAAVDTTGLVAPDLEFRLVGVGDPAALIGTGTGAVNWPAVPRPVSGYQNFGILVIDRANDVAGWQPILLLVTPQPAGVN